MSYYYTLDVLENGVYCLEQFNRSNCSSIEWIIYEDCFEDLSNPTEQEISMHDMLDLKSNGLSIPPQYVWDEFLRLIMIRNLS